MKLIIIYGSEGVGKLTIAKQLAASTNFKLFHNHLSVDVAKSLFAYGEEAYNALVWEVRLLVFKTAAENDIPGVVFTWAYSHPDFQPLLDRLQKTMQPYQVSIDFVFVHCAQDALESRIVQPDRKQADKAHTVEALHRIQLRKNHVEIPDTDSLVIDNTDISAARVSEMIVEHYGLPSHS